MRTSFVIIILSVLPQFLFCQHKRIIRPFPLDLDSSIVIFQKLDSIGKRCINEDGEHMYCYREDLINDSNLEALQKKQKKIIKNNYPFDYIIVDGKNLKDIDYNDKHKYRYVLIYSYEKSKDETYHTWIFHFYDRLTEKNYPDFSYYSSVPLADLKVMLKRLVKFKKENSILVSKS